MFLLVSSAGIDRQSGLSCRSSLKGGPKPAAASFGHLGAGPKPMLSLWLRGVSAGCFVSLPFFEDGSFRTDPFGRPGSMYRGLLGAFHVGSLIGGLMIIICLVDVRAYTTQPHASLVCKSAHWWVDVGTHVSVCQSTYIE